MARKAENVLEIEQRVYRSPDHDVHPLFVERWSPRAMSGEKLPEETLMKLFEAARWAPSSYNGQPWRFLYATRGSQHWDRFFGLLGDFNRKWAENASALVVVVSRKTFESNGKSARTHAFDTGAAWENLALQGSLMEIVVHGMQGFDYEGARRELAVPEAYEVQAMIAIGVPGALESLPPDLREREKPSDRKPLNDIVMKGRFRGED